MLRSILRGRFGSAIFPRWLSSQTEGEQKIVNVLKSKFPEATKIEVEDISGGCGAMYQVHVESEIFTNKRMVMQHRLVNEALSEEVKEMHGLRISTAVPQS
ncbi:bolA-like protein 3 [Anneissia japonica]|uniref:bolA-like protein 3 n=1 Tax=Anneissia japonica TaxID=1529436 RepID=UPI0014258B3C|nr:bolA-like protein 3 [Anneissia japonica]